MKKFSIFAIAAIAAVALSTSTWAQDTVQPSPSDTPVAEAPPIADGTTAPVVMGAADCGCSQGVVSGCSSCGTSACATNACCPQPRRIVLRRNNCCAPAPVCNTCAPAPTCNTCATAAPACNTCTPARTFVAFRRAAPACNTCATAAPVSNCSTCTACATPVSNCNTCTACATARPCNTCTACAPVAMNTVAQVSYQEPVATAVTADSVMAAPVTSAPCCGSTPVVTNDCAPAVNCCNTRRRPLVALRSRIGSRRCCN